MNFPLLAPILILLSDCINSSSLFPVAILCTLLHRENTSFEVWYLQEKSAREVWASYVKDEIDVIHLIQAKAQFSNAITIMDRIGGWIEGRRIDDESNFGGDWQQACGSTSKQSSAMAKITWMFAGTRKVSKYGSYQSGMYTSAENHRWVSEFPLVQQENKILEVLDSNIDVPCIVQWWILWYSAPTSLNDDFLNDDVILETHNKGNNTAFETAFDFPSTQTQTPRTCFLEAQRLMLMICTFGWVRIPERELTGGDIGGRPDLPPQNEDDCHVM